MNVLMHVWAYYVALVVAAMAWRRRRRRRRPGPAACVAAQCNAAADLPDDVLRTVFSIVAAAGDPNDLAALRLTSKRLSPLVDGAAVFFVGLKRVLAEMPPTAAAVDVEVSGGNIAKTKHNVRVAGMLDACLSSAKHQLNPGGSDEQKHKNTASIEVKVAFPYGASDGSAIAAVVNRCAALAKTRWLASRYLGLRIEFSEHPDVGHWRSTEIASVATIGFTTLHTYTSPPRLVP